MPNGCAASWPASSMSASSSLRTSTDRSPIASRSFRPISAMHPRLLDLKEWMKSKPKGGKVIFATQPGSRVETTQAYALGATDVVTSPIDAKELLKKIWSDFAVLGGDSSEFSAQGHQGAAAAHDGLQAIFAAVCLGESLGRPRRSARRARRSSTKSKSKGLSSWIDTVRKHHSQTYQHCLLVTGVAAAFGQHLGLSAVDRNRLSFAGMLHDVGKAMVPVAILEKPRPARSGRDGDHEEASGVRSRSAEKRGRSAAGNDRHRRPSSRISRRIGIPARPAGERDFRPRSHHDDLSMSTAP